MRLEWLLLFLALALFAYSAQQQEQGITLSLDVKNPLQEATFIAGAKTELGPLELAYTAQWGKNSSSKLSFDLEIEPPKRPWVEIQFTTDSLEGILVEKGDQIQEGQLIGFHSVVVQEQIAQLEANLEGAQDELIKAELEAKIAELREQNEVHALVTGLVQSLWVEQVEGNLIAHLRILLGRGAFPGGEKS